MTRGGRVRVMRWLSRHDPGFSALRRAGRAAIVMPLLFALASGVIRNPDVAVFSAFGSFAMLLFVDFGGPLRERVQALATLAVAGGGMGLPRTPGSGAGGVFRGALGLAARGG